MRNKELAYDSINCHFRITVWIWEFFYCVTYPFSAVYRPVPHSMFNSRPVSVVLVHLTSFLSIVCIVSYTLTNNNCRYEVFVPTMLYLVHRALVSTKYACMSENEYKRIMDVKSNRETERFQSQHQLLTGWLTFQKDVINFELTSSALRLGYDINNLHFLIPLPTPDIILQRRHADNTLLEEATYWKSILAASGVNIATIPVTGKYIMMMITVVLLAILFIYYVSNTYRFNYFGEQTEDGYAKVSVKDMSFVLLSHSRQGSFYWGYFNTVIFLSTVILLILPLIMRTDVDYPNKDVWLTIYDISSSIQIFVYSAINMLFVITPINDALQRLYIAKTLTSLVSSEIHKDIQLVEKIGKDHSLSPYGKVPSGSSDNKLKSSRVLAEDARDMEVEMVLESHQVVNFASREISNMANTDSISHEEDDVEDDVHNGDSHPMNVDRPMAPTTQRIPTLDFYITQNVYAWMYTRLILQNYGRRMLFRMDLYTGFYLLFMLALMAFFVVVIYKSDRPGKIRILSSAVFMQCAFLSAVILFLILILILVADQVNAEYRKHVHTISSISIGMETELAMITGKIRKRREHAHAEVSEVESDKYRMGDLDETIKALSRATAAVKLSNEENPLTVLTVVAAKALALSILSTVFAYIITFYSIAVSDSA